MLRAQGSTCIKKAKAVLEWRHDGRSEGSQITWMLKHDHWKHGSSPNVWRGWGLSTTRSYFTVTTKLNCETRWLSQGNVLERVFSLLKEHPGSVDRNPYQPRHRHDDRNLSRSTHSSRGGHPSQTSTKVSGWSPSRSRQDHRDRSSSPLFLARTGERNPSRSPGPHVERQRSLSRERTNSPGSLRRTKEIRCYTCNGVGHFQSVCPSKEIKSVEFSDMDLLDLNSLGSG